MAIEVIVNLLIKIALLTACGFFLKKISIINTPIQKGLNEGYGRS